MKTTSRYPTEIDRFPIFDHEDEAWYVREMDSQGWEVACHSFNTKQECDAFCYGWRSAKD